MKFDAMFLLLLRQRETPFPRHANGRSGLRRPRRVTLLHDGAGLPPEGLGAGESGRVDDLQEHRCAPAFARVGAAVPWRWSALRWLWAPIVPSVQAGGAR